MILFLAFDGVLRPTWPCQEGTAFREVARLLAALEDHPPVEIVVTSSWRQLRHSSEWNDVPEALRARIVGHTPAISRRQYQVYPVGYKPEPIWYMEILLYLKNTKQSDRPWIAIDDDERLFPADCPNLVSCKHGFGDEEQAALRTQLQKSESPRIW